MRELTVSQFASLRCVLGLLSRGLFSQMAGYRGTAACGPLGLRLYSHWHHSPVVSAATSLGGKSVTEWALDVRLPCVVSRRLSILSFCVLEPGWDVSALMSQILIPLLDLDPVY